MEERMESIVRNVHKDVVLGLSASPLLTMISYKGQTLRGIGHVSQINIEESDVEPRI